jgi:hypothetical protein
MSEFNFTDWGQRALQPNWMKQFQLPQADAFSMQGVQPSQADAFRMQGFQALPQDTSGGGNWLSKALSGLFGGNNEDGGGSDWLSRDAIFGNDKKMGWGTGLAQVGKGVGSFMMANKMYDLERDKFNATQEAFNKNWGARTSEYNLALNDREMARASATGNYAGAQASIDKNSIA